MLETHHNNSDPLDCLDDRQAEKDVLKVFRARLDLLHPHEIAAIKNVCQVIANEKLLAWVAGYALAPLENLLDSFLKKRLKSNEEIELTDKDIIEVTDEVTAACEANRN